MNGPGRATVLYDDDCGFCRWTAERLRRWDRHARLAFAPIQGDTGARLLEDLSSHERLDAWHLATPDGHRWTAGAAVPPLLERLPGGRPLAAVAARAPRLTEMLYRAVARRRSSIGRLLGVRACAVDPSRVDGP